MGAIVKIPEFFWRGRSQIQKQHFSHFRVSIDYPAHSLQETVLPKTVVTSSARGDTICLRPLLVDNIFVFIRQVAPVQACWQCKTSATS